MQTAKFPALVFGLALVTSACGDSMSSLNPNAPSSLSPDSLNAQAGAASAESGSMAKGPKPGNGNGNGNGNGGGGNVAQPRIQDGSTAPTSRSRIQIEGLISAVGNDSVTVNAQLVKVTADTVIRHGSRRFNLSELHVGDRVHVSADRVPSATSGATLAAMEIRLQNPGEGVGEGEEEPPPPPTGLVSVTAVDDAASEAGSDTGSFRFTRTGDLSLLSAPLTVTFSLAGSANNGGDYQNVPLTVVFPANQSSVDVSITPVADSIAEGVESVLLTLVDAAPYELGSPIAATVNISDPPGPTVRIAADQSIVSSNFGFGIFVLTRTGDLSGALTVSVSVSGSAAEYAGTLPTTIAFSAGSATASVFFMTAPDGDTVDETVVMTVLDGAGYDPGSPASATITVTPN